MFIKPVCFLILCAGLLISQQARTHEYWLQAERYQLQQEDNIKVDIRVGQHFKGNAYAYLPDEIESANLYLDRLSQAVEGRFGDIPAFNISTAGEGLFILAVSTRPFKLTYTEAGKFENFLEYDGLDWVLKAHKKRGLPMTGFTEAYRRHAKLLVKSGKGGGADRRTGLEFEWVMSTNPYTHDSDTLSAQLWWRGKHFTNAPYRVFLRKDGQVSETRYKTDDNGIATFPRVDNALYMLNAVHMITPTQDLVEDMDAVWESRWASVTFTTPAH